MLQELYDHKKNISRVFEQYEQLFSGTGVFLASSGNSWVLDSYPSYHMTGSRNLFVSLSSTSFIPSISITDGSQCPLEESSRLLLIFLLNFFCLFPNF